MSEVCLSCVHYTPQKSNNGANGCNKAEYDYKGNYGPFYQRANCIHDPDKNLKDLFEPISKDHQDYHRLQTQLENALKDQDKLLSDIATLKNRLVSIPETDHDRSLTPFTRYNR